MDLSSRMTSLSATTFSCEISLFSYLSYQPLETSDWGKYDGKKGVALEDIVLEDKEKRDTESAE